MAKKHPSPRATVGRGKRQNNSADIITPRQIRNQNNSTSGEDRKYIRELLKGGNTITLAGNDSNNGITIAKDSSSNGITIARDNSSNGIKVAKNNGDNGITVVKSRGGSNGITIAKDNSNNAITVVRENSKNDVEVATEDNIDALGRPKHEGPRGVKRKRSKSAIILAIIVVLFALMAIYGVLGMGFVQQSNLSLFQGMDQLSQVAEYIESVRASFGVTPGQSPLLIRLTSYALIVIPIIVAFFSVFKSKVMQIIGMLVSFLELGMFIFAGVYVYQLSANLLGNFQGNFLNSIYQNATNVIGLPAYLLLIGVIGMVLFTIIRLIALIITSLIPQKRVIH